MTISNVVYHVALSADVDQALNSGSYTCKSLDLEGFIHCCTAKQLSGVVERYYQGSEDVKLLAVLIDKLEQSIVFENTVGGEELFPHYYAAINMSAVDNIMAFEKNRRSQIIESILIV